jgi:hypothetical protein
MAGLGLRVEGLGARRFEVLGTGFRDMGDRFMVARGEEVQEGSGRASASQAVGREAAENGDDEEKRRHAERDVGGGALACDCVSRADDWLSCLEGVAHGSLRA